MNALGPGTFEPAAGMWIQLPKTRGTWRGRPALFLDRDGTVLHEILYLHTAEETWLADGAEDVIAAANRHDAAVVIVTNQAGIGRGFYGWSDFAAVQEKMAAELERRGAAIDAVFACPFHAEAEPPFRHPDHPARKPNPGMLLRAGAELGLDMARSWIIGNYHTDLAAGRAAGCAGGVHLATGHGTEPDQAEKTRALESPRFNVTFAKAVGEAIGAVPFLTGN